MIVAIKVDVFDMTGERTSMNQSVTVKRPLGYTAWTSVTYDIINTN